MKVAIHQPNFLPWFGYFYKMAQADVFIFFDEAQYTKQSFIKRVNIHQADTDREMTYLTIPLKKHSDYSRISELQISDQQNWKKKIKRKVYEAYHKLPYYLEVDRLIETHLMPSEYEHLADLNMYLIQSLVKILDIKAKLKVSSDLGIKEPNNLNMCLSLGATTYISGLGGKKYLNEESFQSNSIDVIYANPKELLIENQMDQRFWQTSIIGMMAAYGQEHLKKLLV